MRHGRWKRVRTRGSNRAPSRGPSTSPVRFLWKRLRKAVALRGSCSYNNLCALPSIRPSALRPWRNGASISQTPRLSLPALLWRLRTRAKTMAKPASSVTTISKNASRRTLKSDLARVDAHVISAKEYRELPQLTSDMLARAKVKKGGRPRSLNPRKLISLRLPADLIARWKATGPGWQTRMAERLGKPR